MKNLYHYFEGIDNLRYKLKISPYVLLIFIVVAATIMQFFIQNVLHIENTPLLMYVMVPLLASWFGGFRIGLFSTVFSIFVADYLFLEPMGSVLQTPQEIGRMLVFFLQGFIISALNELRNRSDQKKLEALRNEVKARKEAEEAKRSRDDFISMTSHELKNPLTSIKAYIQLMQKRVVKDNNRTYKQYLLKIEEHTDRMTRLISDLLSISKLQVGKLEVKKTVLNINECVQEVVEAYSINDAKHKIVVKGKCTRTILGDKVRIIQVLTNLITNAIKYSPKAKEVLISLSENKRYISISVTDYGLGIKKKDQNKLFSKYFRVQGTDEKHYKGFGMGLYIVSEILKLHNGKIDVISIEGKGSTFTIKLPVASV